MLTFKQSLNIAFVVVLATGAFSLPAFSKTEEGTTNKNLVDTRKTDGAEFWVSQGIKEVNSGNIDRAIDCFAEAGKLVPIKGDS